MKPLVFVGPSLSHRECSQFLRAEFLPPARRGVLESVASESVVALIDGELPPGDPLLDREISEALSRGIKLYGAASVGAFCAAAFTRQGMRGSGWVYDQYISGRITSVDEIAVIYDPLSMQVLSVPLVDVRFWLDGLIAVSRATPTEARKVLIELRELSVFNRDILAIKNVLHGMFPEGAVQKELETMTAFPNIKRRDARQLLRLLASLPAK